MRNAILSAVAALGFAAPAPVDAQASSPLFASNDVIHIAISAPLSTLMRNRASSQPVAGTLTDPAGQSLPVAVSIRSTTRRNSDVCDFAPLRVSFTAPPAPSSMFAGQSKLKLVTHCGSSPGAQQYELLEYAAYRMLNQLTPRSFRVRLASIDYRDGNGRPMFTRYGFFIEDLKDVARRNGLKPAHAPDRIPAADLSPPDSARYALFQHMIANHDWSMRAPSVGKDCCHNAEMLGTLVYDRPVRDRVIAGQRRRVRDFAPDRIEQRLRDVLATLGV